MTAVMACLLCDDTGWVCEAHPIPTSHGRARTSALAARPVRHARAAMPPPPTSRHACRRGLRLRDRNCAAREQLGEPGHVTLFRGSARSCLQPPNLPQAGPRLLRFPAPDVRVGRRSASTSFLDADRRLLCCRERSPLHRVKRFAADTRIQPGTSLAAQLAR
jgi:hypothetical protein